MQKIRPFLVLSILLAATFACANPLQGNTPAAPSNVETVVAQTLTALTAFAPQTGVTPPPATSSLLPHSLYFLNNDSKGIIQVYRLEKDGKTVTQLTFEPANVEYYDVSPIDGSIVYVSKNQLLNVRADGSNRSMLVDGGPIPQNDIKAQITNTIRSPLWSKDGQEIFFHYKGLSSYSIVNGNFTTPLSVQFNTDFPDMLREDYWPESFSPDGSKILINITFIENGTMGIFNPASGQMYRLTRSDQGLVCCVTSWSPDGNTIFAASPTEGMIDSGLWRFDVATGTGTTLIGNPSSGFGPYSFADAPIVGPDGQLYFFFNTATENPSGHTPFKLVRSALDGVTGRTEVRPDVFENINEVLWAPDVSLAVVAFAPVQDVYEGGQAEIVYPDGRPNVVLTSFALNMKWGP